MYPKQTSTDKWLEWDKTKKIERQDLHIVWKGKINLSMQIFSLVHCIIMVKQALEN